MNKIKLFINSLIVLIVQIVSSLELSDEECLQIGFRKTDILCTKCEQLVKFDLNSLKDSCLKCCHKESLESTKKYSSARLEFCGCPTHKANFPQTNAFINNRFNKFPNLSVKYVKGADPVLKLMNANGVVVEELNIQKWDTDTIDEFLAEQLSDKS